MDVVTSRFASRFAWVLLVLGLLLQVACGQTPREQAVFPQSTPECVSQVSSTHYLVRWIDGKITTTAALDREDLLVNFVRPNLERLQYVEPVEILRPQKFVVVSSTKDIFSRADDTLNWGVRETRSDQVWPSGHKGGGVTVAVIDSGVEVRHPQLTPRIFINAAEANGLPGVDDDKNGFVDDVNGWNFADKSPEQRDDQGHGTHVAGIIAADPAFGPIQGVAPEAKILPLDFMDTQGGNAADALASIDYAVKAGARVINASWSSYGCSKTLEEEIKSLEAQGVLFVAAAGNSRNNLSKNPEYPAAFNTRSQITVGAVTPDFIRAGFSNFGNLVHVVAPGTDIISTYPGERYALMQGTSMAAPFVAGEAALLLSAFPEATVLQLRAAILAAVDKGNFGVQTNGSIRADLAIQALAQIVNKR